MFLSFSSHHHHHYYYHHCSSCEVLPDRALCLCPREISMEKLNLDSDAAPKAESRRDVVDVSVPPVSDGERKSFSPQAVRSRVSMTVSRWTNLSLCFVQKPTAVIDPPTTPKVPAAQEPPRSQSHSSLRRSLFLHWPEAEHTDRSRYASRWQERPNSLTADRGGGGGGAQYVPVMSFSSAMPSLF